VPDSPARVSRASPDPASLGFPGHPRPLHPDGQRASVPLSGPAGLGYPRGSSQPPRRVAQPTSAALPGPDRPLASRASSRAPRLDSPAGVTAAFPEPGRLLPPGTSGRRIRIPPMAPVSITGCSPIRFALRYRWPRLLVRWAASWHRADWGHRGAHVIQVAGCAAGHGRLATRWAWAQGRQVHPAPRRLMIRCPCMTQCPQDTVLLRRAFIDRTGFSRDRGKSAQIPGFPTAISASLDRG
jgi:hypothetical protein